MGGKVQEHKEGAEEQSHQNGGDGDPFEKIGDPEAKGDRAETVAFLDDECPVKVEREADQPAGESKNPEKEEARQEEVLFPGGQAVDEPGEEAAEKDGEGESVVKEALNGSEPMGIESVAGDLRERLAVDLSPEHVRDLMAVKAEVADVKPLQHPAHQEGGDKYRQEKDHETVPLYHRFVSLPSFPRTVCRQWVSEVNPIDRTVSKLKPMSRTNPDR